MKNFKTMIMILSLAAIAFACGTGSQTETATAEASPVGGGQSTVEDNVSQPNIVQAAVGSADHTTLVAALQAAEYVDALANAGPFTVFAPTNDAFGKLPEGTVETLVKPENQATLRNILEYHVYIGVIGESLYRNNTNWGQANGDKIVLKVDGDKKMVNDANVIATVPTSNGIIYVIDGVLLPPEK
ncbi:MAG: fasciclin domain-containing protein [Flammeovirgaceae bacterium]|nr:fasciclin domain-containing protein [Flammeovirgaceae bacterium]